jgi:L-lactate utilization protein LutC
LTNEEELIKELEKKYGKKRTQEMIRDAIELAELAEKEKISEDVFDKLIYYIEVLQSEVEKYTDEQLVSATKSLLKDTGDASTTSPEIIKRMVKRPHIWEKHLEEIVKYIVVDLKMANTFEAGYFGALWTIAGELKRRL